MVSVWAGQIKLVCVKDNDDRQLGPEYSSSDRRGDWVQLGQQEDHGGRQSQVSGAHLSPDTQHRLVGSVV